MGFLLVKYVHITSVAASFALFFVRGFWVMRSYPQPQEQWVRILPHLVDGLLVASALGILILSPQKGWPGDWLTVKLVLVMLYVGMAQYLFRVARVIIIKAIVWLLALLVFLFVTTIAVLHDPRGILSVL